MIEFISHLSCCGSLYISWVRQFSGWKKKTIKKYIKTTKQQNNKTKLSLILYILSCFDTIEINLVSSFCPKPFPCLHSIWHTSNPEKVTLHSSALWDSIRPVMRRTELTAASWKNVWREQEHSTHCECVP